MSKCICGFHEPCAGRCARHGRDLHGYPCGACAAEWEAANPRTAAAITKLAAGRGSSAEVARARKADHAARTTPP